VIHLTCKDLNRNALESEAWLLHSEGFNNVLAMTGDYPVAGNGGSAKPVFDIDSVGLISLLDQMNRGLDPNEVRGGVARARFERTNFLVGAVTTNFKLLEGEVMPQYAKLAAKIRCGARFIINQIGFDARKMSELRAHTRAHGLHATPLIGNVYLLNARVASLFHEGRIPGVVLTRELHELCMKHAASADGGKAFFLEFAAKQIAIYRGLGFRGAYLGGVHTSPVFRDRKSFFSTPKIRPRASPIRTSAPSQPQRARDIPVWFTHSRRRRTPRCSRPAARSLARAQSSARARTIPRRGRS
jgi:methylenetetrahydrofolate reductase (NADPH)